jgi:hypothetical protein
MKPLPKWIGVISTLIALVAPGGALFDMVPPKYAAIVAGIAAVIAALSHSLTGTGGQPQTS